MDLLLSSKRYFYKCCFFSSGHSETLKLFRAVFGAVGRGRRLSLPQFDLKAVTHETFLQLYQLKIEANASWETANGWMRRLLPTITKLNPQRLMEKVACNFMKADNKLVFMKSSMNLDAIGPYCSGLKIFRSTATDGFPMPAVRPVMCHSAITEINGVYGIGIACEILHCFFPETSCQNWKALVHKILLVQKD